MKKSEMKGTDKYTIANNKNAKLPIKSFTLSYLKRVAGSDKSNFF
jgi:hypothetical protein